MSSSYFSIIHILILALIFALSTLFFILSLKAERKLLFPLIFTNVLVSTAVALFLMLVTDKYTKKGVIENIKNQRVLRTESIVFKGRVTNVGRFDISACTLVIKLINQPLTKDGLTGEALFKPSGLSLFSWISNDIKTNEKPNTVEHKFKIAQNLKAKKSVDFSVSMPFPPYFKNTTTTTKLNCY